MSQTGPTDRHTTVQYRRANRFRNGRPKNYNPKTASTKVINTWTGSFKCVVNVLRRTRLGIVWMYEDRKYDWKTCGIVLRCTKLYYATMCMVACICRLIFSATIIFFSKNIVLCAMPATQYFFEKIMCCGKFVKTDYFFKK